MSASTPRDDRPAWAGLAANLALAALKVGVGILGRSGALLADGVHSAADAVGSVAVLVGLAVARRPADPGHPYGHGKAESVAALVVAILLGLAGVEVAAASAGRLLRPVAGPPPATAALWVAALSVVVKEALYRYGRALGLRHRSPALLSSAEDHRSDALSSLAAVGGILGARLGLPLLDPAAGFFVSLFILRWGWLLTLGAVGDLIDARGEPATLARVEAEAARVAGVAAVHLVRTRRMGSGVLVDLEIGVDASRTLREAHAVADGVRERIVARLPEVRDVMVHVNPVEAGAAAPGAGRGPGAGGPGPGRARAARVASGARRGSGRGGGDGAR
jgi:cation diffusion facilitator family transporter